MKAMKKLQIVFLSVIVVYATTMPAYSVMTSQTTTGDSPIVVDQNAPGTKLSGTLTTYYERIDSTTNADMHVFLRLRKGATLYGFSAVFTDVPYFGEGALTEQQKKIDEFLYNQVIPEIYCDPDLPCEVPSFAIKSVEDIVQDDPFCGFCDDERYFAIMDIVIAVID